MKDQHPEHSGLIAGVTLILTAVGAIAVMLHHPTLGSPGHESLAHEAAAEAGMNGLVHGTMIVFTLAYYFALTIFSNHLGRTRTSVIAAQLSLALATISMVGAALVSGFMTPEIASSFVYRGMEGEFKPILLAMSALNKLLATLGTIGYSIAIMLWSVLLVRMSGIIRVTGVTGIFVGAIIIGGLITNHLTLGVHGMTVIVTMMSVWLLLVASLLIRRVI